MRFSSAIGAALVTGAALAACLDLDLDPAADPPALGVEAQGVGSGSGSGSNACAIIDYGSRSCPAGQRCRQPPPAWVPRWRRTYDLVPSTYGEPCGVLADGAPLRCGWGEVCIDATPAGFDALTTPDDQDAVVAGGKLCAPDPWQPVPGRWSLTARHANGAITSPPRPPSQPSSSIALPSPVSFTSPGGAPRAYHPAAPSPDGPEGAWRAVGPLQCATPPTAIAAYPAAIDERAKVMGAWKSNGCTAADPNACNPGGDRVWFVFADGIFSWESRWTAPGPEQYLRPGIKAAARLWFLSNGFKYVERAIYVNNHGSYLQGVMGVPDRAAVDGLAEVIAEARACNVDYLSIVSHSNGVYTSHGGVHEAWVDNVWADVPTPIMTISIHNLQAAIARNAGFPGLLLSSELAALASSDLPVEIEQWWTSGDALTWFPGVAQWIVDWANDKLHTGGMLSGGHRAAEQWFSEILRPDLQAASGTIRVRGRETDNCVNLDPDAPWAGVCDLGTLMVGPGHDAIEALRYVATWGYSNYGPCADPSAADCYGFHWQTTHSNPMWSPSTQRGWVSKYYPGAALDGHDFQARPAHVGGNP